MLGSRGMQKLSRYYAVAGERLLRVKRTRGSPGCDFFASLKCFPFTRRQAESLENSVLYSEYYILWSIRNQGAVMP